METFLSLYLIVGIAVASFTCGLLTFKSITLMESIGLVLFFIMIVAGWPMVVAYLAPSLTA